MKKKAGKETINRHRDSKGKAARSARTGRKKAAQEGADHVKARDEISPEMGMRLKKARESRGLSLFDLYLRTNISVDLLAQIEEGKFVPPLGTVIHLAKALDMKIGYFISGEEEKSYTIVRRDDRKVTPRYDSGKEKHYGYEYESLAPHKTDRRMEPFLVTLEPSETDEERSTHDGQEFIFVLQGEMEVRLEDDIHILEPGDCIYYDSTVPHLVKCHSKKPAKILAVLYAGK